MPVSFKPEIAVMVCAHIADGKSLRQIEKIEGMPSKSGILAWLLEGEALKAEGDVSNPKSVFVDQYARAREMQADVLFDETLDIADDDKGDLGFDDDGKPFLKHDNIQRAKLRVDTRRWIVGKLRPKKYGEKQTVETTGTDGGPIAVSVRFMREDDVDKV